MSASLSPLGKGKKSLELLYRDRCSLWRTIIENQMSQWKRLYQELPCHLSLENMGRHQQTAGPALVEKRYTLFLPAGSDIHPGDKVEIIHQRRRVEGMVGQVHHYDLCVQAALEEIQVIPIPEEETDESGE